MPTIELNLSGPNAARLNAAFQGLSPIPQIPDPEFEGNPGEAPRIDQYTALQWAKILIRRHLSSEVHRWENKQAREAAAVPEDPDIAT